MEPRPEAGLPATLGRWVGEIVLSIPQPARRTVAELIVGGLLAGGGHVTQAFLALMPRLGWQAYHWMLEHGRVRLLGLVAALCGIVRPESHGGRGFARCQQSGRRRHDGPVGQSVEEARQQQRSEGHPVSTPARVGSGAGRVVASYSREYASSVNLNMKGSALQERALER